MASTINASTTAGLIQSGDTSGQLQLQTNSGQTAVTIDTSQNVGIGTTTMTGKFNVSAGRSFFAGNSEQYSIGVGYNQSRVSSGAQVYYIGATDSATPALVFSEAGGAEKMRIDSSGNVGIGTTLSGTPVPNGVFNVYGLGYLESIFRATQVLVNNSTAYNASPTTGIAFGFKYKSDGTVGTSAGIYGAKENATDNNYAAYLGFGTSANGGSVTERMRIDSSGKVFIGTTSMTQGYLVANLIVGGTAAPMIKWQSTNGPKAWDGFIDSAGTNLYWAYNGTDKAYINASTGAWTTTSDLRAKKDITDITYGLNAVMELRPVSYLMNEDEDTSKKHLGFIAQEVKTVIDEAVDDVEEGKMYGFDKSGLIPVLVKAIQEQQTIINDLTARITALEGAK